MEGIGNIELVDGSNQGIFTIEEIKNYLEPVFEGKNIKSAVLFGSYGKGTATSVSDIDILVDSGLKGLEFVGLIEEIKRTLHGKDVDIIDVSHVDRGSLVDKEIKNTGVKIYAK